VTLESRVGGGQSLFVADVPRRACPACVAEAEHAFAQVKPGDFELSILHHRAEDRVEKKGRRAPNA
jgi:hypothetical protein